MFEDLLLSPLFFGLLLGMLITWYYYAGKISEKSSLIETIKQVARQKDIKFNELSRNFDSIKVEQKKVSNGLDDGIVEKEAEINRLEARIRSMQDNFTIIDGIGKKVSSILRSANIDTFSKLASTDILTLNKIIEDADPRILRLTDPTTWSDQARLAAENDLVALSALKLELKEKK
ncbi:MAG: hypothetical protein ACTSX1_08905 [Candidatus Heimdallarchaeaceae archaeon]